ncbi:MAG: MBL fold metallo-hydrolase [Elusimicrobia bacterium]|nr:MBL fold metallo-hydrolase [Elusimicrobiota bacterium]
MPSKFRLLFIVLLITALLVTKSWADSVKVTFIGHATVLIENDDVRLLTDPFFGDKILGKIVRKIPPACSAENLPPITLVLISHTHPDHFDLGSIGKLKGDPVIIMPWGRKNDLKKYAAKAIELKPGESYEKSGIKLTAIPARHMYGNCLGYIIEIAGQKIYFTGDTKLFSGIEKLSTQNIDLMLLPFDGTPVFGSIWTINESVEAIKKIQPKIFVPIHYGTFQNWSSGKKSRKPDELVKASEKNGAVSSGKIVNVGESLTLRDENANDKK